MRHANGAQERFLDRLEDYAAARGKYIIDKQLLGTLKRDAVIMHPLPRVDEVRCHSWLSNVGDLAVRCGHNAVACRPSKETHPSIIYVP